MYLCFMYSRRLYAKIVGGAVLIVLLSLIGSWLLITRLSFFLSFVCLLFILLITLFIIRLATRLNYKLSVFFEAMRNEDTTQHFPANPDDPFTNALYADMNHILRQLGDKHIEIEEKSLYYESILRVMTHEIRNSVTPIASLSADLLKHLDRTSISRQREGLEVINSQVKNLTAFLDSYHRLTHLPEPEYKTVSVPALFTKLERLLQAEPRSERVVYCDGKADKSTGKELQVYGDANLLTLALINLIRNALQAVEGQEDGIVRVDTCAGATGHLLIIITDNGSGIPPERLSAIFTPFFSTKSGGSGIGLPISQRIMQCMAANFPSHPYRMSGQSFGWSFNIPIRNPDLLPEHLHSSIWAWGHFAGSGGRTGTCVSGNRSGLPGASASAVRRYS